MKCRNQGGGHTRLRENKCKGPEVGRDLTCRLGVLEQNRVAHVAEGHRGRGRGQGLWGLMAVVSTTVSLCSKVIEISFGLRHEKLSEYFIRYGEIKNSEEINRWRS